MKEFIEKIIQTLNSNGFPEKRVSLPTEKMYEAADNKGLSFNDVLEKLKLEHQIEGKIGPEKIIFSQVKVEVETMGQEEIIKQAQEMMSQMDPEELKQLQEMFMNMTPEQKEELTKKGKDMGLL